MEHFSLYELNSLVQSVLKQTLRQQYWVEAELAEATERHGHLFLDLIQKEEGTNTPVARASAKCWSNTWMPIRLHFERITGQRLKVGMKVLLQVYPQFHPAYGFTWIVTDIDPTFTLGDMARRRLEIINQLKAEGVYDLQKELVLSRFCRRIAIVSSETAAGYGDFCNQLADNEYGFSFSVSLFPAIMQGENVEGSVVAALDRINAVADDFDCVVIIRGGGATSDMSGFDTLLLAENVANFPIPIITGIGHDRDESILDLVSFHAVKTPTAAAAFLISNLASTNDELEDMRDRIVQIVQQRLETERVRMASLSTRLPVQFSLIKTRESSRLDNIMQQIVSKMVYNVQREQHRVDIIEKALPMRIASIVEHQRHRLDMFAQRAASLDPQLILNRGYSMTLAGGHVVTDASQVCDGEVLETRLANGVILSQKLKTE